MKIATFIVKAMLVALVIAGATYFFALTKTYYALQGFLLDKIVALGFEPSFVASGVTLVALALTPLLAGTLIRIAFGDFLNRKVAVSSALAIAAVGAYVAVTHDWLFDAKGRSLAYLCPPSGVDKKPAITWRSSDPHLGVECHAVTRENAIAVVALRQGKEPSKIELQKPAEIDQLVTHRYGHAVVFASANGDFFDGPGWNPQSPDLLRAVTPSDLKVKRAALQVLEEKRLADAELASKAKTLAAEQKRLAEQSAAKAALEAVASERKALEEQLAKSLQEAQHLTAQRNEVEARGAQRKREQAHQERLATLEEQRRTAHRKFFNIDALDDDASTLVVWANGLQVASQEYTAIESEVVGPGKKFYRADGFVNQAFITTARPADVMTGEYGGLSRLVLPKGLKRIVFVRVDERWCENGRWVFRVSLATYDVKQNTVEPNFKQVRA